MKKIYLAAALCAIFLPLSTQASGVSFHQARALMTQRADTLKMSQADIDQKQQQVKESRSLRGPKISLNAQQIEGRKDIHMAFDNPLAGASGMFWSTSDDGAGRAGDWAAEAVCAVAGCCT